MYKEIYCHSCFIPKLGNHKSKTNKSIPKGFYYASVISLLWIQLTKWRFYFIGERFCIFILLIGCYVLYEKSNIFNIIENLNFTYEISYIPVDICPIQWLIATLVTEYKWKPVILIFNDIENIINRMFQYRDYHFDYNSFFTTFYITSLISSLVFFEKIQLRELNEIYERLRYPQ